MSLTDFVNWDKYLFNSFIEKPNTPINPKPILIASPITQNYGTVGTAFDYVMRLWLFKLNPNLTNDFPLVAKHGVLNHKKRREFISQFEIKRLALKNNYIDLKELLPDCITLAKLDSVYRTGTDYPDSDIFHINNQDINDLSRLVGIIPSNELKPKYRCVFNPTFSTSSSDVGGADADFIIDDTLIDIKTTIHFNLSLELLRQLVGYWFLDCREYYKMNKFYGLKNLGLYFARYGLLITYPIRSITKSINDEWIKESITYLSKQYPPQKDERGNLCKHSSVWILDDVMENGCEKYSKELYLTEPYFDISLQKDLILNNNINPTLMHPILFEILDMALMEYKDALTEVK